MNDNVKLLETISMNAHPSLNTYLYDGWYLRFANGYTNRANSVNMLYPSSLKATDKIHFCEKLYRSQKLPVVFKITPLSIDLDPVLEEMNYTLVTKTNIMVVDLAEYNTKESTAIVTSGINEEWQKHSYQLNQMKERSIQTAVLMQSNIIDQTLCASIFIQGEAAASGLCVIENDYAGLYDIIVSDKYRHKGYGRAICTSLLASAARQGAKTGYLQVVDDNDIAKALYKSLGFTMEYQYWYRVKQ